MIAIENEWNIVLCFIKLYTRAPPKPVPSPGVLHQRVARRRYHSKEKERRVSEVDPSSRTNDVVLFPVFADGTVAEWRGNAECIHEVHSLRAQHPRDAVELLE